MPRFKLTKKLVDATASNNSDVIIWDTELKGFGCKITPAGNKSYFLYYRTHDGRQRRPKIGDHGVITCEYARDTARQWLADVTKGHDPSSEKHRLRHNPTIKELFLRYMQEYAPHKKPLSQQRDKRLGEMYIIPSLGHFKISSISRDDIVNLHKNMQKINANRMLSLLSKMLNLAELWGYRADGTNPCRHVKKHQENKRERFLNQAEIICLQQVLLEEESKKIEMPSVLYAIHLLLLTGCRLNEILSLRWQEINFEKSCLFLSDSKTGKRTVYLSPQALKLLKGIPREQNNPYVIIGRKNQSHLVNLQKPWKRIRNKAGLTDVRIHDLRHTFASVAAASGLSLPMIGALLGHKQTQTTARYAHLVGQPLLEASEKISNKIMRNIDHA
jgi:integrase